MKEGSFGGNLTCGMTKIICTKNSENLIVELAEVSEQEVN